MLNEEFVDGQPINDAGFCQDLTYQYVVFRSEHDYWLAAMLSMPREFVYRGDDFMHIESPYIMYQN